MTQCHEPRQLMRLIPGRGLRALLIRRLCGGCVLRSRHPSLNVPRATVMTGPTEAAAGDRGFVVDHASQQQRPPRPQRESRTARAAQARRGRDSRPPVSTPAPIPREHSGQSLSRPPPARSGPQRTRMPNGAPIPRHPIAGEVGRASGPLSAVCRPDSSDAFHAPTLREFSRLRARRPLGVAHWMVDPGIPIRFGGHNS